MERAREMQQLHRRHFGRIVLSIVIVATLLVAAAIAIIILRSGNDSASTYSQFKEAMLEIKKMGDDYAENDMKLQAEYYYGIAGSSISAMRFAVDNLMYMKGAEKALEDEVENPYIDWDSIAGISLASPYPYYFEGLVYHIQGDENKAEEAYKNAILNPNFPQKGISFFYLNELSIDELSVIRDELYAIETDIYNLFTPEQHNYERHPMNYSDEYLRAMGKEVLEQEPDNYAKAQKYYYAALMTNPFEVSNFVSCAVIAIFNNDIEAAIYYINEGLWIDENSEELNQVASWLRQND